MKTPTIFDLMEALRDDGWCVVLKCLPRHLPWILEGSRSEYDVIGKETAIGRGRWYAEVQDVSGEQKYRHSEWAMAETPADAMTKVFAAVQRAKDYERARRIKEGE